MSSNIVLGRKPKRFDDDGIERDRRSRAPGVVHLFLLLCGKTNAGLEVRGAFRFKE